MTIADQYRKACADLKRAATDVCTLDAATQEAELQGAMRAQETLTSEVRRLRKLLEAA